jgi:hypothetical protein
MRSQACGRVFIGCLAGHSGKLVRWPFLAASLQRNRRQDALLSFGNHLRVKGCRTCVARTLPRPPVLDQGFDVADPKIQEEDEVVRQTASQHVLHLRVAATCPAIPCVDWLEQEESAWEETKRCTQHG